MKGLSRRDFLAGASALGLAPRLRAAVQEVEINLYRPASVLAHEVVRFGVPLAPGLLQDPERVAVIHESGRELEFMAGPLETWRRPGAEGSVRALGIQFPLDFRRQETQRVKLVIGGTTGKRWHGEEIPASAVMAWLPASWLCTSEVAGPQIPAAESGAYSPYDACVERHLRQAAKYVRSKVFHEWLFDRSTALLKIYVRRGQSPDLRSAREAAEFLRDQTRSNGDAAGEFLLKPGDPKYVYPQAMHIAYLLTGDTRFLETGKAMARYCLKHAVTRYVADQAPPAPGEDPERGRPVWTPRSAAFGLLGVLHGWEMTGERIYWEKAREYVDQIDGHQKAPPDGRPPDGSLRQNWARYDPSEATFEGATSPWMMALLLDALFQYWLLSNDPRVPEIVTRWCDFLDRRGFQPDGVRTWYVVNCFGGSDGQPAGVGDASMAQHHLEIVYSLAMGIFFTRDSAQREAWRRRFDRIFPAAAATNYTSSVRTFNWAFQASSQLVYFLLRTPQR